jgi:hypothetical protein
MDQKDYNPGAAEDPGAGEEVPSIPEPPLFPVDVQDDEEVTGP